MLGDFQNMTGHGNLLYLWDKPALRKGWNQMTSRSFFFFYLKGISLAAVCDFCLLSIHCTPLSRVWPCLPYRLLQAVENFRPTSLPSYRLNKTATPFMQYFQAPQAFRWPSEFASPSQQLSHTRGTSMAAIFDFFNISSAFLLILL